MGGKGPVNTYPGPLPLPVGNPGDEGTRGPQGTPGIPVPWNSCSRDMFKLFFSLRVKEVIQGTRASEEVKELL